MRPGPILADPPLTGHVRRSPHRASRVATIPLRTHPAATTPVEFAGCFLRSLPQQSQPSPFCGRVGFHISPFEACTAFAYNCGLRARQVTYVTLYTEGFGRFVSSTTAPIATGRNESCRVGLPPTGESRLSTAHHNPGTLNLSWSHMWHGTFELWSST
jgi:hypothetical protein